MESLALVPAYDESGAGYVALIVGHAAAEEERRDRNIEGACDPAERVNGRAREASLDLGDEALRDACLLGDGLQGQLLLEAKRANTGTELEEIAVSLVREQGRFQSSLRGQLYPLAV